MDILDAVLLYGRGFPTLRVQRDNVGFITAELTAYPSDKEDADNFSGQGKTISEALADLGRGMSIDVGKEA